MKRQKNRLRQLVFSLATRNLHFTFLGLNFLPQIKLFGFVCVFFCFRIFSLSFLLPVVLLLTLIVFPLLFSQMYKSPFFFQADYAY